MLEMSEGSVVCPDVIAKAELVAVSVGYDDAVLVTAIVGAIQAERDRCVKIAMVGVASSHSLVSTTAQIIAEAILDGDVP